MDDDLLPRLVSTRTIEITTTGRRSGLGVRIEIWWFRFEDRFLITGTPGPRHWLANLQADPRIVVHALGLDLPGTTLPVDDLDLRRRFFAWPDPEVEWYLANATFDDLVTTAPMVEVLLEPDL